MAGADNLSWKSKSRLDLNDIQYLMNIHDQIQNVYTFHDILVALTKYYYYTERFRTTIIQKMHEYRTLIKYDFMKIAYINLYRHLYQTYTDKSHSEAQYIRLFIRDHSARAQEA